MTPRSFLPLCVAFCFLFQPTFAAEDLPGFSIREPFGLAWGPDPVQYRIDLPQGRVKADGALRLVDEQGQIVPMQLTVLNAWPDQSIRTVTICFSASLAPDQVRTWKLLLSAKEAPATDLQVQEGDAIELSTSKTAIRLPAGSKTFNPPLAADQVPAPIQAIRLPNGKWVGRGWWQTEVKCTGYAVQIEKRGPVFARVSLRYDFEGGRTYSAQVDLHAGSDLAVISESYNLSEGKPMPMSGVGGMKADQRYSYVLPAFDSPDRALMWDWWGQTHARLPNPNAYCFSFDGLQPDSAQFHGRSQYGNLREGDGGLTYDQDGRFAYLNAYFQWGDEESLYMGLYNSSDPADMLGVVGLLPSQWLHPDITPHPDVTIQQYVQTTCLVFERRKSGEAFFRAPADLGKRVYGIGGLQRTLDRHLVSERYGPRPSKEPVWGAPLMQRHVRMGRLTLNTVKDWVLDYDEPSKYPRLFVPEGDRARYESRRTRKPLDVVQKDLEARKGPTDAEKKAVVEALAKTSALVRHFAQADKGHMDFGIEEGVLSDLAEDALASPACTPEQARELRKWLAAIAYFALHPDFVPPRTAGFGWGSANMMAQIQCRACRIVALLPNHPRGRDWRTQLAKVVTLYVEDQVNPAGATLECPHYGSMAITMPVMGLAALSSCGDVDMSRAQQRLRAAAQMRLATLLPYDLRGGFRSQTPQGDGYYDGEQTFAPLAGFFHTRDVELARQLAWGVRESNNDLGGHADSTFKLFDPGIEPLQPALGSAHFPGYGAVMRNGFPRRDEAYLQIFADGFSWGHGHCDRGTWVMYAKGAPLMIDFAGMYTPTMRQMWMHPGGLAFDIDQTARPATDHPDNDWWRKSNNEQYRKLATAPFTSVEPRSSPTAKDSLDTFGRITTFQTRPQADFAVMQRRIGYLHRVPFALQPSHGAEIFDDSVRQEIYLDKPFTWTRRFVFVKDADPVGHNYLVIRDDLPDNTQLDPFLNLWCLATKLDVQGQTAIYTGQHGVDLHCYIAEPATFIPFSRTLGHSAGFAFGKHYTATFGKKFREEQIQLQIPQSKRGAGYFVAIVPVKQGEAAPKFQTLAGGKALRVTFPDRTDTIILQGDGGKVEIDGRIVTAGSALLFGNDLIDLAQAPRLAPAAK